MLYYENVLVHKNWFINVIIQLGKQNIAVDIRSSLEKEGFKGIEIEQVSSRISLSKSDTLQLNLRLPRPGNGGYLNPMKIPSIKFTMNMLYMKLAEIKRYI